MLAEKLFQKITKAFKDKQLKRSIIGNGFDFIVYDCREPKYLFDNQGESETKKVPEQLLRNLPKIAYCDEEEQVWRNNTMNVDEIHASYLTVNVKKSSAGYSPLGSLVTKLKQMNLCEEFLKFYSHPSYFNKNIKPPIECSDVKQVNKQNESTKTTDSPSRNQTKNQSNTTKKRNKLNNKLITIFIFWD